MRFECGGHSSFCALLGKTTAITAVAASLSCGGSAHTPDKGKKFLLPRDESVVHTAQENWSNTEASPLPASKFQ